MSGDRLCCVVGCRNNSNAMKRWKNEFCHIHNCNYGISRCVCLPPFVLITFPKKDDETRREWI